MLKPAENADGSTRQVHLGAWKRQEFDARDKSHSLKLQGALLDRPTSVDWRRMCSPVEDQGELGSCTACMMAGIVEFLQLKRTSKTLGAVVHDTGAPNVSVSDVAVSSTGIITYTTTITPSVTPPPPTPDQTPTFVNVSRLFGYYTTRMLSNTTGEDSGASIRDTMKAANKYGCADELNWPYEINKFTKRPPQTLFDAAASKKITSYHAIADGDIETMKTALASGFMIGFGFDVYSAFMTHKMASDGLLCRPKAGEIPQGGHAVALVGYDEKRVMPDGSVGSFLVRNSWGRNWGFEGSGYYWQAANYIGDPKLCSDFWVVQLNPFAQAA